MDKILKEAKEYGEDLIDKAKDYIGFSGRNRKKKINKALDEVSSLPGKRAKNVKVGKMT